MPGRIFLNLCTLYVLSACLALILAVKLPQTIALIAREGAISLETASKFKNSLWVDATGSDWLYYLPAGAVGIKYMPPKTDFLIAEAVDRMEPVVVFCHTGCSKSREVRRTLLQKYSNATIYYLLSGDLNLEKR